MSSNRPPSIQIWQFKDSPEEFRRLSPFGRGIYGDAQLVIYISKEMSELLREDDDTMPRALWFLSNEPKYKGQIQYAGSGFGLYSMYYLADGSRIVITCSSTADDEMDL